MEELGQCRLLVMATSECIIVVMAMSEFMIITISHCMVTLVIYMFELQMAVTVIIHLRCDVPFYFFFAFLVHIFACSDSQRDISSRINDLFCALSLHSQCATIRWCRGVIQNGHYTGPHRSLRAHSDWGAADSPRGTIVRFTPYIDIQIHIYTARCIYLRVLGRARYCVAFHWLSQPIRALFARSRPIMFKRWYLSLYIGFIYVYLFTCISCVLTGNGSRLDRAPSLQTTARVSWKRVDTQMPKMDLKCPKTI